MGILENGRVIGFTGTQFGMTGDQHNALISLLDHSDIKQFHHGDCLGADEWAHTILHSLNVFYKILIFVHPPIIPTKRAFCAGDIIYAPKGYIERNHNIVNSTDELFATPRTMKEEVRSGTWATIRYAKKMGKKVTIIYPNGNMEVLNNESS